ncbi:spore germination protein GerPE [Ornithinibacillus sp. L9]|uniref:Spore germination protein GerPE n=1 Tax=Ornithinibacillus caprae TaxID=2678566 RepID=A0A6N8FKY8_9BACI|nr:spore germination protein GerPE [Ornithinibacillus caprae]MUK90125.1 spore germination protein GerPE [Ornithinibacillus caprae]
MTRKRLARVNHVRMHALSFGSIFNIGDTNNANPTSRAIALQQEGAVFNDEEDLQFEDYPIFQLEPNWVEDKRTVTMNSIHHAETIRVGNVRITGASQSGIVQIGSIKKINADARIKHFRKIRSEED